MHYQSQKNLIPLYRVGFENPPTAAQLKELVYLRDVINEAMRLYHPCEKSTSAINQIYADNLVGLNIKVAKNDTSLPTGGGPAGKDPVAIPAGTQVSKL